METRHEARVVLSAALALGLVLLSTACVSIQLAVQPPTLVSEPRWACPTNTPLPYGPDGPIKNQVPRPTAVPSGPEEFDTEYYAEWEQEYGALGGPPFPAPTPYTRSGYQYGFGQIVNLRPDVDVTVVTEATPYTDGDNQLYVLSATWQNRGAPLVIEPVRQLVISAIQQPSGGQLGGLWTASTQALALATAHGVGELLTDSTLVSMTLDVATTTIRLPILAPRSTVGTVDLRFDPFGATVRDAGTLRVQFINKADPLCAHPGTIDARYNTPARPVANNGGGGGGEGGGGAPPPGGPVPPGLAGIVNVARKYAQANRPYCWGGKGYALCAGNPAIGYADACRSPSQWPCFDCSGFSYVVYLEGANTVIGHGTANQQNYPSVHPSDLQPGDLMLFGGVNQHGRGAFITHVGVYVGDVTGDGTGDLIHAIAYPDGVVVTNNVLGNSWYRTHLAIITRPPLGQDR